MNRPKYGQKIKYFIVKSDSGDFKVAEYAVSVEKGMKEYSHQINYMYYIEKYINSALKKLLFTFGIDVDVKKKFYFF